MSQEASPHRHISFTAHYTGYIWYYLGISHPVLASTKGRILAKLVYPIEALAERFLGGSMRTTLKARHALIDRQLDSLIAQNPNLQILELACGLSPRGWRYRKQYKDLCYVESDLPAMVEAKKHALSQLEEPLPKVVAVDLFAEGLDELLQQFDHSQPLVIITEGLVNYFSKEMLAILWSKLATGLKNYPLGVYLTDLYPEPTQHKLATLIWNSSKLLKIASKSAFSFHFTTPAEAIQAFNKAGFSKTVVYQPSDSNNTLQTKHLGDLVWVVDAQVT